MERDTATARDLDLDIDRWLSHFRVRYVDPRTLGNLVVIHKLTTYGRGAHLGDDDIWIASDMKAFTPIILLHEGIENYLRRSGWDYRSSHDAALRAEVETFAGTALYRRYVAALGEHAEGRQAAEGVGRSVSPCGPELRAMVLEVDRFIEDVLREHGDVFDEDETADVQLLMARAMAFLAFGRCPEAEQAAERAGSLVADVLDRAMATAQKESS